MSCGSDSSHWAQASAIKDASSAILAASLSAAGIFGAILIFGISMLGTVPQLDWLLHDIRFFLTISIAAIVLSCASSLLSMACLLGYHRVFYPMLISFVLLIVAILSLCWLARSIFSSSGT
jgi:hypothetical protein